MVPALYERYWMAYWILDTVQCSIQNAPKKKAPTYVEALEFFGGASLIRTGDLRIMIPSL